MKNFKEKLTENLSDVDNSSEKEKQHSNSIQRRTWYNMVLASKSRFMCF